MPECSGNLNCEEQTANQGFQKINVFNVIKFSKPLKDIGLADHHHNFRIPSALQIPYTGSLQVLSNNHFQAPTFNILPLSHSGLKAFLEINKDCLAKAEITIPEGIITTGAQRLDFHKSRFNGRLQVAAKSVSGQELNLIPLANGVYASLSPIGKIEIKLEMPKAFASG
ncbi:MAG TPA: hypothetical protein VNK26_03955, partial [Pyrinomonadaceae bacterium]|nr:hypothetical protein [Pyrinomonadaceae bacterium]